MTAIDIRAVDVPELRAGLISHLESDLGLERLFDRFGDRISIPAKQGDMPIRTEAIRRVVVSALSHKETELYFVSSAMTCLAKAAAKSLGRFGVEPPDLPSPRGFMVFEEPYVFIEDQMAAPGFPLAQVMAVSWDASSGSGLMSVVYYADWHRFLDELADLRGPEVVAQGRSRGHRLYVETLSLEPIDGTAEEGNAYAAFPQIMAPVISTWLLMQQPLAGSEAVTPNHASRKRIQRMRQEPKPVRVINLRRASNSTGSSESDREYHHQWIVRGHWRQQWYPSREVHRPVWIAPHVKGPEGAPLLGGEKVHAWVR